MIKAGQETILNMQLSKSSITASPHGWSWSEERVHAGTFRIFGLSCSHIFTPRCHSGIITDRCRWWHCCEHRENQLVQLSQDHRASRHIQRACDALSQPYYNKTLFYNILCWTKYINLPMMCSSSVDQTRLKAVVTLHADDWLHTQPMLVRWSQWLQTFT